MGYTDSKVPLSDKGIKLVLSDDKVIGTLFGDVYVITVTVQAIITTAQIGSDDVGSDDRIHLNIPYLFQNQVQV